MEEVTLQALLEAGSHFGHKAERWHPKAAGFIYAEKDGIHIIDLAQTKSGLDRAAQFVRDQVAAGGEVLFVGTKRQARGVLKEEAEKAGAPYFVERWIGGFLTNWDGVKLNIEKILKLSDELEAGAWKKFPKHEQSKLKRYLDGLRVYYGGVLNLKAVPNALFIIDIKKEDSAVREAQRMGLPVIAIVDTNANPEGIDYVIPANDDAVGSIAYISRIMAGAYKEGKDAREKENEASEKPAAAIKKEVVKETVAEKPKKTDTVKSAAGKRGRPKKVKTELKSQ